MLSEEGVKSDVFERTERLLFAWGDDVRTKTDELGLPTMSGLAGIVRLQQVHDEQTAARGGKRRKVTSLLRNGIRMRRCRKCSDKHRASLLECPKCGTKLSGKEIEHELRRELGAFEVHGTATRSMKPPAVQELSGNTSAIEAVMLNAPSGSLDRGIPSIQTILLRRYLHQRSAADEAQHFRVRKSTYKEWVAAAVEYVAQRLAQRRGVAL